MNMQAPQMNMQGAQMNMQGPQMQVQGPHMQAPQMQAPHLPQMQTPPLSAPASVPAPKASSNTLLIVIFCLLAFLAGGIVVYLLARR